ncbi:MAG: DUF1849 family protein [Rhodospirillales bacterium]|jgi:hypothetical protein|nr:hypothetical protein [Rhodospirillaceae bacterium]MDP6427174.1 DUF1849 family protein [Rhodospirillales bacterium]MDP6646568.1 DUF1849 family protein [Rhodospirillales bacterium]MDP6840960.1 DUF1849 family protein [Rhodospirillales bacterium]
MNAGLRSAALLAAIAIFCGGRAIAASVQPHQAFYEISVREWKLPGAVADYSGTQILRLESTCAAWRLVGRFALSAAMQNGRRLSFETEISNTEAKDGTRLQFDHQTRMNGRPLGPIRGVASRSGPGAAGRIELSIPGNRTLQLPREARFPVASFLWTAAQVKKGARTMNYVLFDGSSPEPVRVFELLTGKPGKLEPPPKGDTGLLRRPGWRTVGSFHRYAGGGSKPLTTVTQNIYDNGIAGEITFDIGLAVVSLKLRAIRKLPEPAC